MTPCRFTIDVLRETALNTGRPLYRVTCKVHGLIHPATTGPDHWVNVHLDSGETWNVES